MKALVLDDTLFTFAYVRKYSWIHSPSRTVPSPVVRLSVCRLNNIGGRWLNIGCKVSVELKLRTQTVYSEVVLFTTATLSTKNLTWTALESDPGFCGEKPGLSYGTALSLSVTSFSSGCLTSGNTASIQYFVECITAEKPWKTSNKSKLNDIVWLRYYTRNGIILAVSKV